MPHSKLPRYLHRLLHAGTAALLALACAAAQAALITFDEFPSPHGPDEEVNWDETPISDQYAALGVIFHGGFLQRAYPGAQFTQSQSLLGGHDFSISFTGTLPKYVNLRFTGVGGEQEAYVSASTTLGRSFVASTGGYSWGGPDVGMVYTPYRLNSFASFHAEEGIRGLSFNAFASTRLTGHIDDLYFGAVPAVPEPASLALMGWGLAVVAGVARRRQRTPKV